MKVDEAKIEALLSRNVEELIDRKHLREALMADKKLRVKLGIDPTSPDLHLGHAVVLRKMREFQDLGCVAVLIIGDFTGQVGDPTGRSKTRQPLSAAEVKKNEKAYLKHAGKILDMKKAEVVHNNDWFSKEGIAAIMKLASSASMQQILHRADFKKRLAEDSDVTLLEMLYPLFQGYDSVQVKADVELGGTDQLLNLLMGRQVQKRYGMPEQDVLTVPLLEGLDGEKKMSKSYGNYIGLDETPEDMFGKIMSLPDALVLKYFMLCTDLSEKEVARFKKELGPKELKEKLAAEVVTLYHGIKAAIAAQENFEKVFSRREIPDDIPDLKLKKSEMSALEVVVSARIFTSKSEARRLIEQGGFDVDSQVIKDPKKPLKIKGGEVVKIGKRRFFRLTI